MSAPPRLPTLRPAGARVMPLVASEGYQWSGMLKATGIRGFIARVSGAALVPVAVLVTLIAVALVSLDVPATSFRSPDEHAGYLFTRVFAETGRLSYTADYLQADEENLLHPRGALTLDGRAVPFNYLGLPVLYAPAYHLLGEHIRYVAIPLAVLTVGALAAAGSMLAPRRRWLAWAALLGATPIVYYLNRPFLNTLPSLAFMSVGLYLLMDYYRSETPGRRGRLWGASAAFAVAAFARYEFAIFEALFVAIVLLQKHQMKLRRATADMMLFIATMGVVFVLPVLILNTLTYGSPLTFGYGLFNEAYFPDRTSAAPFPMNFVRLARAILLPAYPFDLSLTSNAFIHQALGVAPVFAIVALLGLISVVRNRAVPAGYMAAYGLLAVYVFLYRGAGYSWLADSPTANLEASVVRYALPIYVGFYLLAVYGLAQVQSGHVAATLVGILVLVGLLGAFRDVGGHLLHIKTQVRASDEVTRTEILPNTEPDALIYTDVFDKTIGPYRDVAAWWGGVRGTHGAFFQPDDVARSISRVYPSRPVYLYVFEEDFVVPQLDDALERWGLEVSAMGPKRLYRIERASDVGAASAGP